VILFRYFVIHIPFYSKENSKYSISNGVLFECGHFKESLCFF